MSLKWASSVRPHPGVFLPALTAMLLLSWPEAADAQSSLRAPIRDPARFTQNYVMSYKEIKGFQIVFQKRDFSCGAAALATIGRYYWGDDVTEETFLGLMPKLKLTDAQIKDRVEKGLTLTDLRDLANLAGYDASMGKLTFEELTQAKAPLIVGLVVNGYDHFVVVRGAIDGWVYLADPIRGNLRIPTALFLRQWQKNAVLVLVKSGADVPDMSPMAVRYSEVTRGWLNDQHIRQDVLTIKPIVPVGIRP